mmetsp:Transcript_43500/g.114333  ORF Transcript_43500/g.114333 Transcript_43500/m.114333 type:complete len:100 (-) Transcript_43500:373-672(-)
MTVAAVTAATVSTLEVQSFIWVLVGLRAGLTILAGVVGVLRLLGLIGAAGFMYASAARDLYLDPPLVSHGVTLLLQPWASVRPRQTSWSNGNDEDDGPC